MARTAVKRSTREDLKTLETKPPYIDLEDVKLKYEKAAQLSCKPGDGFMKVKEGHIFDEDKSVKWNRQEVERVNNEYQEEVKRLNDIRNEAFVDANAYAYKYITQETGLPEEKGEVFWSYVYRQFHHDYSMFDNLEELIEFYNDINE